jgi:hypothetical protein
MPVGDLEEKVFAEWCAEYDQEIARIKARQPDSNGYLPASFIKGPDRDDPEFKARVERRLLLDAVEQLTRTKSRPRRRPNPVEFPTLKAWYIDYLARHDIVPGRGRLQDGPPTERELSALAAAAFPKHRVPRATLRGLLAEVWGDQRRRRGEH